MCKGIVRPAAEACRPDLAVLKLFPLSSPARLNHCVFRPANMRRPAHKCCQSVHVRWQRGSDIDTRLAALELEAQTAAVQVKALGTLPTTHSGDSLPFLPPAVAPVEWTHLSALACSAYWGSASKLARSCLTGL